MTLPTVLNVAQARLVFANTNAPRSATCTLNFIKTAGGYPSPATLYAAMDAAVAANMWVMCADTTAVTNVIITPLDGATAGQSFSTGSPAKWKSAGSPDLILQGATVMSIKSAFRGPKWRNRIYLPWVGEGSQANGVLNGTSLGLCATAWAAFFAAMSTAGYPGVVVSPSEEASAPISSIVFGPYMRTQRRRVRR